MLKRFVPFVIGLLSACASIDCPLDSKVECTYTFYDSETSARLDIADTLSVSLCRGNRQDSLMLNRLTRSNRFVLPVHITGESDTILLDWKSTWQVSARDTIIVSRTCEPHFENIECPASMFHNITDIRFVTHDLTETSPAKIDSVIVVRPFINYDNIENVRIYLNTKAR